MFDRDYYYLNRTACEVMEEMRILTKQLNQSNWERYKANIPMMIEELQIMCNRMESGLDLKHSYQKLSDKRKRLTEKVKRLEEAAASLEKKDSEDD